MDLDKSSQSKSDPGHRHAAPIESANVNSGNRTHIQHGHFHGNVSMGTDEPSSMLNAYKWSLSFPEMYSRYYGITSTSGNSTCWWLSDCEEYKKWENDGGLLWIKGKPGSGKSTLMRCTLDKRKNPVGENSEEKKGITLSFFFHGRGSSLQKTMLGFYRTILFQLLEQLPIREEKLAALLNLENLFRYQCDSRGPPGKGWQWETSQLAQDFQSALVEVLKDRLVYLYIDALDECGEDDARRLAETFKKMLQRSPAKRSENRTQKSTGTMTKEPVGKRLHICCSCQEPPLLISTMLKDTFQTFQICVDRHNGHGISDYVWSQLDVSFSSQISEAIINRSSGVFLWAYLVVERVKTLYSRGFTKKEIEDSIDEIPQDLEKLYEDLFQNMLGNEDSLRLIYWVCYAKGPLTLEKLRWALFLMANPTVKSLEDCRSARNFPCDCDRYMECTCKVMERRVQNLGHGLVEITDSNGNQVVEFIHPSVQEFFLEKDALVRLYKSTSKSKPKNHDHIVKKVKESMSQTCDRYNQMMELKVGDSLLSLR